jgi:predicted glutamine amidotransferase
MTDTDVKELLKRYAEDSRFFLVHVRYATCEKKEEFNHPFVYDNFLGVHNGVVTVDNETSGSDSMDMFNAINKAYKGSMIKAIKDATKTLRGSFSVLLFEYGTKALYYYRNTPAYVCSREKHNLRCDRYRRT